MNPQDAQNIHTQAQDAPSVEAMEHAICQALQDQIATQPILMYIKGTPDAPACRFSAMIVQLLKSYEVAFSFVDVLSIPDVRRLLPLVSNFPTFPQLFVQGELLGGSDVVQKMHEAGELEGILKSAEASQS